MPLRTDYKNDVLDTSKNTKRKYQQTTNSDGTISLDDVTVYSQEGSLLGANDINATNNAVNELNQNLNGFEFKVEDGVPMWKNESAGADTFAPFKRGFTVFQNGEFKIQPTSQDTNWTINSDGNLYANGGDNNGRHCYICFPYTQELSKYKKLCAEIKTNSGVGLGHRTNAVGYQIGNNRDYCSSGDYLPIVSRNLKETSLIGGLALEKLAVGGFFCVIAQFASGTHYYEISRIWLE